MADPLRQLTSQERVEMIRWSVFASKIRTITKPDGLDRFLFDCDFTQDEKDYVLFNINQLSQIGKYTLPQFKAKVKEFKEND